MGNTVYCVYCMLILYIVLSQSAVNHIQWSPFRHDVFLSCSSDWSIQLWKQGHFTPVLSFTSVQSAMCSVKWSPNWPTLFAAINGQQLEIWELNVNVWVRRIILSLMLLPCLSFSLKQPCVHWVYISPVSVSPTIVQYSAPGVEMTALLFATETDCVLVGDSDGQVNVYKLKNLNVRQDKQVKWRWWPILLVAKHVKYRNVFIVNLFSLKYRYNTLICSCFAAGFQRNEDEI